VLEHAHDRPTARESAATAYRLIASAQGRLSKALEDLEHWSGDPDRAEPAILAAIEHEAGAARAELSAGTIAAGYAYTGALVELWSKVAGAQPRDLRITLDPEGTAEQDAPILASILDEVMPQLRGESMPISEPPAAPPRIEPEANVAPVPAVSRWGAR
jgi:hypothetical protein